MTPNKSNGFSNRGGPLLNSLVAAHSSHLTVSIIPSKNLRTGGKHKVKNKFNYILQKNIYRTHREMSEIVGVNDNNDLFV